MARSRPGIQQLVLLDAGTLATTPAGAISVGLRNAVPVKRSAYKPVKDYLNRSFRNKVNFNIQAESLQPSPYVLSKLIGWLNGNVDVQAITRKQSASADSEDVWKFISQTVGSVTRDMKLGLDFEYLLTGDKRSVKLTLEAAFEYEVAKAFIDLADSASAVSLSGITGRGEDATKYKAPFFLAFESPAATSILTRDEIVERTYSFKTKNTKSDEDNRSLVDYLSCEITLKFRNASVANQVAVMAKDNLPSLLIKESNGGAYYDAYSFGAGSLSLEDEYDDSDEDRSLTLKFMGDVHVYDISFAFGDTNGGSAADTTGSLGTGGTVSFA
jgi:hypothetical protein